MSSTKNTKENRKVLRANYYPPEHVFKIPNNLDLEDKSVIESWGVKWGKLYITYVGKEEQEVIEQVYESEVDYKFPENVEIVDADDCGYIDYSEDEEEEEEKEKEEEKE